MNVGEALYQLGVRDDTLTAEEKSFLDENGYLPLLNLLSKEQAQAIAARLEYLVAEEGAEAGKEFKQEAGAIRLSDVANKGEVFDICYTHPRVLAAIAHVLGNDLKLSSLNSRFALPGEGLQRLHVDWKEAVPPDQYQVCNSIWLIDDFTSENGATRVVPGSQRKGKLPQDEMADPMATHPDERLLIAPAGTVVIFNSHTWHGGTLNKSDKPRRAIHSYFCRRDQPQQVDQRKYIRPETYRRLSEAARFILDV
jgi:ectoine hydroxylase-related dioxygenase (phytanoyl-CoA dioxygenase family)